VTATKDTAAFAVGLRYEDIPERIHAKTKAQILSVLGASHAGRHSEGAVSALETARTWGSGDEAVAWLSGQRLPRHSAIFANACASVSFDFDDYVFAGHTGHSAVCTSFAYGELNASSGKDVLAAITVGNEVGARLGASLLFGPQNGQMWSYIHVLEAACIVSRFLGLDAARTANAIGIAFTQPPYALMPAFMGPDSKLLIPSSTTVEGCRAAELASHGWTGNTEILEDRQGFLRKFNADNLGWMLSGYGDAWLSDTMTIKVVPGCAYIDTAIDAFVEMDPSRDEIERIDVRCGVLTSGMEAFSSMYRTEGHLAPISINFSVALSIGLILVAGSLRPEFLSHAYIDAHRDEIEEAASLVTVTHDADLDQGTGTHIGPLLQAKTLEGYSFEDYVMSFPAVVTVTMKDGRTREVRQDVPLGAAGRPVDETAALVRAKFLSNFAGDAGRAEEALDAIEHLEDVDDIRTIAPLLAAT
jgi:2-methylcitrate dehydratase PrpD